MLIYSFLRVEKGLSQFRLCLDVIFLGQRCNPICLRSQAGRGNYIQKHDGGLITTIRNDTDNTMDDRITITRKQKWEGKQLYGRFKRLINNISHNKTWTWLRKGNFKRETESLPIAAHNNTIRTNQIKVRIDKTQQNSKCWLCGD